MAYLDHAATTPMLDEAVAAYVAAAREVGNASSLHAPGRLARRRVEESRECIAAALGARPSEVIFTGGGTEADNLAVTGHKLGGPVGVGALILGRDVACTPLLHGGGQERDVRSGTLDVAGIVAFAAAVEGSVKRQQEHAAAVGALRDDLIARVRAAF